MQGCVVMRIKQRDQEQDRLALLARRWKMKVQAEVEIKALSSRWAAKLTALDEAIRTPPGGSRPHTRSRQDGRQQILKTTTQLVRDAVAETNGEFTISTIAERINQLPTQEVKQRELRTAL